MKRIPTDIDRLMWSVAEDSTPQAISDFESRFPDLRVELGKRIRTLHALKVARPSMALSSIPRFAMTTSQAGPKRWIWVMGATAAAAIGMGSYMLTARSLTPTKPAEQAVRTNEIITPTVPPGADDSMAPKIVPKSVTTPKKEVGPPIGQVAPKLYTIRIKGLPIEAALLAVGQHTELKVEIAPGFDGKLIDVDLGNMTGMEMLSELGALHGFTALNEGEGRVLVVPVRANESVPIEENQNP